MRLPLQLPGSEAPAGRAAENPELRRLTGLVGALESRNTELAQQLADAKVRLASADHIIPECLMDQLRESRAARAQAEAQLAKVQQNLELTQHRMSIAEQSRAYWKKKASEEESRARVAESELELVKRHVADNRSHLDQLLREAASAAEYRGKFQQATQELQRERDLAEKARQAARARHQQK